jgi:AcrR family transcriptional regulator
MHMAKIVAQKGSDKKATIARKAAALFRQKGFAQTSMRALGEHMGVEASSLYNHIGSKNELLQSICFKVANDFMQESEAVEKLSETVTRKIEKLIRFHIHKMLTDYDEVYVSNHEWKQLQEPYLSNFLHQRRLYEKRLTELIELGMQKKEIKKTDAGIAVFTILSAVRGLEFWHQSKKQTNATALADQLVDQLLNGLVKKNS